MHAQWGTGADVIQLAIYVTYLVSSTLRDVLRQGPIRPHSTRHSNTPSCIVLLYVGVAWFC